MSGLSPSIIAADPLRLSEALKLVESYAATWHVDVMDGHHVPNLTIGPMFVEAIAAASSVPQDVHLMVANPDDSWEWYADAGARRIAFHPDQSPDARDVLTRIRGRGCGAGVAVNPDVGVDEVEQLLDLVDLVIVMSVYPGFSGQEFIPDVLPKLKELRRTVDERGLGIELVVDGGVNLETAPACVDAGADLLVSASAVFGSEEPSRTAERLRALAVGRGSRDGA